MSEQQKESKFRTLGKLKNINTKNGTLQKIYMDNLEYQDKDGKVNQYYQGALIWVDLKTGKQYQVKQLQFWQPKNGMNQALVDKGFSHFITLNIEDDYEVKALT